MEQERSQELQQNIAREALGLLALGCGEKGVDKHEQAIRIIGTGCGIPEEETGKLLDLITQAKAAPEKVSTGEITLGDKKDTMANWSAQDTFWVLMDLFQVAIILNTQEERAAMYSMAEELTATQNLEDWLNGNK